MVTIVNKCIFERFVSNIIRDLNGIEAVNIGGWVAGFDIGIDGAAIMLVGVTNGSDRLHICYEIEGDGRGVEGIVGKLTNSNMPPVERIYVGNDARTRNVVDGRTPAGVLADFGLESVTVGGSLRWRLSSLRQCMFGDFGLSRVTIEPRCSRLIADLRTCKVRRSVSDGLEYVNHDQSHTIDALGYLVMGVLN